MLKKHKVSNIIIFIIVCLIEIVCILCYLDCLRLMATDSLDALGIIVILPLFLIGTFVNFILSIIISVLNKKINKERIQQEKGKSKLGKFLVFFSWLFFVINILLFIFLYIK